MLKPQCAVLCANRPERSSSKNPRSFTAGRAARAKNWPGKRCRSMLGRPPACRGASDTASLKTLAFRPRLGSNGMGRGLRRQTPALALAGRPGSNKPLNTTLRIPSGRRDLPASSPSRKHPRRNDAVVTLHLHLQHPIHRHRLQPPERPACRAEPRRALRTP